MKYIIRLITLVFCINFWVFVTVQAQDIVDFQCEQARILDPQGCYFTGQYTDAQGVTQTHSAGGCKRENNKESEILDLHEFCGRAPHDDEIQLELSNPFETNFVVDRNSIDGLFRIVLTTFFAILALVFLIIFLFALFKFNTEIFSSGDFAEWTQYIYGGIAGTIFSFGSIFVINLLFYLTSGGQSGNVFDFEKEFDTLLRRPCPAYEVDLCRQYDVSCMVDTTSGECTNKP